MKKILKAAGLILALLAIYYLAQTLVTTVITIIQIVPKIFQEALSGTQPDVGQLTEELLNAVGGQTPWILAVSILIAVPSYLLIYKNRRQELLTFISLRGIGPISIPVLVIFALSLNFVIELLMVLASQLSFLSPVFEQYNELAKMITGGSLIPSLLTVGILGPIFEEILFRGLVFGELRKISKAGVAIFIQALLFGIYHMNLIQGTYAFIIGLLLGYIYYRSNAIIAPMIVHITINSSTVLLPYLLSDKMFESWGTAIFAASILLFFATGAFILLSRSFRHTMDNSLYEANRAPKLPAEDL